MKRDKLIKYRVSTEEKNEIKSKAESTGLSVSEYCRSVALSYLVKSKLSRKELIVYKMLHQFYRNFNLLSNLIKRRDPSFSNELRLLAKEMKNHLKKFQ